VDDFSGQDSYVPEAGLFDYESVDRVSAFNRQYKNFSLKQGFVVDLYDVDDEDNIGKVGPEYDILVFEQVEDGPQSPVLYKNAISADMFGGIADFFIFKRRKRPDEDNDPVIQKGSLVLLLCTDGNPDKAVIIGAIPHGGNKRRLKKADGQALEWEYNGLNVQVGDDGSISITQRGKTDIDGKQVTPLGSQVTFGPDGSLTLHDGDGGARGEDGAMQPPSVGTESIKLDKPGKKVTVNSGGDVSVTAAAKISMEAGSDYSLKCVKMAIEATGSAEMKALSFKGEFDTQYQLKSKMMQMEAEMMFMLKSKQVIIQSPIINILGQAINLGVAGGKPALNKDTKYFGTGFAGFPVMSSAVGPFSTGVLIG